MNNDCNHNWIANSGNAGEPEFKVNKQISLKPIMHVKCSLCNSRTWVDKDYWDEYLEQQKI